MQGKWVPVGCGVGCLLKVNAVPRHGSGGRSGKQSSSDRYDSIVPLISVEQEHNICVVAQGRHMPDDCMALITKSCMWPNALQLKVGVQNCVYYISLLYLGFAFGSAA